MCYCHIYNIITIIVTIIIVVIIVVINFIMVVVIISTATVANNIADPGDPRHDETRIAQTRPYWTSSVRQAVPANSSLRQAALDKR